MAELLQSIILSDVTLFFVMGLMMVLITTWALSMREYAGYLLGWLIGFLLILLISVFFVGRVPAQIDEVQARVFIGPAVFLGLVVASIMGLGVGFASLALVRADSTVRSKAARALTVAIATSFTLGSGYLMILASFSLRLVIAVFALAVAIGALLHFIFAQPRLRQALDTPEVFPEAAGHENGLAQPAEPVVPEADFPSPLAQRIHNLRQRARRFGE
jgi:hypothetical protein